MVGRAFKATNSHTRIEIPFQFSPEWTKVDLNWFSAKFFDFPLNYHSTDTSFNLQPSLTFVTDLNNHVVVMFSVLTRGGGGFL
jgi:hypothetical protein